MHPPLLFSPSPNLALSSERQQQMITWMTALRNQICEAFEAIEREYAAAHSAQNPGSFTRTVWERPEGGGGEMALMRGQVFEKVGVNISAVYGTLSEAFLGQLPGTENSRDFWATGISLVAHMQSPLVPAVHMNTRCISTGEYWIGGGTDLTPTFVEEADTLQFHHALEQCCAPFSPEYYPRFKAACDDYFFLPHRNEPRGVGGIFYDYHRCRDWEEDVAFTQAVGNTFLSTFPDIVRRHMDQPWTAEQKQQQRIKRGRYVEFNLLYDRGTKFGLMTNGNVEAILMSLPPEVCW